MKRVSIHYSKAIRFKRWSRKNYAIFCSIGRCVTIGRVRKSVTEASLSKQRGKLNTGVNNTFIAGVLTALIPFDDDVVEQTVQLISPQLVVQQVPLQQPQINQLSSACAEEVIVINSVPQNSFW